MRSPESRAREVAERLAAVIGTEARTTETADAIRIEADVPTGVTTELLTAVLTVLGTADSYGHDHTAAADVVWAEITRHP